ncbi:hypothetical protein BG015_004696, partial [Linnemannia schmuckeri]
MPPNFGLEHYRPDPNKTKAMEGVELLSQELPTQEFNDFVIGFLNEYSRSDSTRFDSHS